ncbi:MAG: SLBB domain-containing protein, partial [bacterium]|nr:SLBB domain-containing protein [bacterium]
MIDLERLLLRGEVALNQRLETGDTLVVPEDLTARVYVLDEVARPGTYLLPPGSSLLGLVSAAGGLTEVAVPTEAQLLRPGQPRQVISPERVLAGDDDYLTKPMFPSYHSIWFELH